MKSNEKAFTLLEVLLVIFIIGVLAVVTGSRFSSIIGISEMEVSCRQIVSVLLRTRQLAIHETEQHGVRFNLEENSYCIFREEDEILVEYDLNNGIGFQEVNFTGTDNEVIFFPLGSAQSGSLAITGDTVYNYRIIVSGPAGRVRSEKVTDD